MHLRIHYPYYYPLTLYVPAAILFLLESSFSSIGEGQSCIKESHKDFVPLVTLVCWWYC